MALARDHHDIAGPGDVERRTNRSTTVDVGREPVTVSGVDAGESTCSCQQDCGQEICGNSVCCDATGETAAGCPQDCATGCGDEVCLGGEDACTCPEDCGAGSCGAFW